PDGQVEQRHRLTDDALAGNERLQPVNRPKHVITVERVRKGRGGEAPEGVECFRRETGPVAHLHFSSMPVVPTFASMGAYFAISSLLKSLRVPHSLYWFSAQLRTRTSSR